jgi:hypothetical protein
MALEAQKGFDEFVMQRIEQREQKGIDEHDHAKQRCVGLPMTTNGDIPTRVRIWHTGNSVLSASAWESKALE